jgi:hypothetical protein
VSLEPLPENSFIQSVQIDDTTVPGGILDFSSGAVSARLKITVNANGGRISGHVKNEKDVNVTALAFVAMMRDQRESETGILSSGLSPEGRYQFKGLAPGRYRLLAISFGMAEDIDGVFRKYGGQAEIVEIGEGGKIEKDLKLVTVEEDHGTPN